MKATSIYTASSYSGALSLARQDGHTGEPTRRFWVGGQWHLAYPSTYPQLTLWQLRAARFKAWLAGFRHRAIVDTQRQIMRELRHG